MKIPNSVVEPFNGTADSKSNLFGVFDGMGGEESGEMAALIAAEYASKITPGEDPAYDLHRFCMNTNRAICDYADEHDIYSTGTTAAMLAFNDKEIVMCNIGDSKVFQFSDGKLEQLSTDDHGIAYFNTKPPLLQHLGIDESEMLIDPHISHLEYNAGDIYLICSDGLTDMVDTETISRTLKENDDINVSGNDLLDLALERGGIDNITIILCEICKKEQPKFSL